MIDNIDPEGSTVSKFTTSVKSNPNLIYDEDSEKYIFKIGQLNYELGKIAEGKKGANIAITGSKYDGRGTVCDIKTTIDKTIYPNGVEGLAKSQVNQSGISEVNMLVASLEESKTVVLLQTTVTYEDNSTNTYVVVVGNLTKSMLNSIICADHSFNTYDQLNGVTTSLSSVKPDVKVSDIIMAD